MIKLVRIDHRLIHGQVSFSWTSYLEITRIIVIDDETANDEFRRMSINIAKPNGVRLNIFTVQEAIKKMEKVEKLNDNVMILFATTKSASEFSKGYPKFSELNLGGIPKKENSKLYGRVVYLDDDEVNDLCEIQSLGINLFIQQVPAEKKEKLVL